MNVPTLTLDNGVTMPALGFGVFQSPPEQTGTAVAEALRIGYRHVDTAAAYGNEREVGQAITASGVPRQEVFIETKVWISDYGFEATLHAFEKSAGKLGVDQLDLFILHQPLPTENRRSTLADPVLARLGATHGRTPAQVMLRWHLQQGRSAIPKSVRPERIAEKFATIATIATIDAMDAMDTSQPDPGDRRQTHPRGSRHRPITPWTG